MTKRTTDAGLQLLALMMNRLLHDIAGTHRRVISADDLSLQVTMSFGIRQTHVELAAPVGPKLRATCRALYVSDSGPGLAGLVQTAEELAELVRRLSDMRDDLKGMIGQVSRRARSRVAAAQRAGTMVSLTHVRLKTVDADEPLIPTATVRLEVLGDSLTPRPHDFDAATADEVAAEFSGILQRQSALSARKAELAAQGADGTIDSVALAALKHRGFNLAKVLKELLAAPDDVLVVADGFRFVWNAGRAGASVPLAPGVVYGSAMVRFDAAPAKLGHHLVGQPVSGVLKHPLIPADAVITEARGNEGSAGWIRMHQQPHLHFNARTGVAW